MNGKPFGAFDPMCFYAIDASGQTFIADSGLNRAGKSFTLTSVGVPSD